MLETSARLLKLLSLFQGRRYWSGADLAERLEITSRTLRRDVDKLRSLGYPIHSSTGVEGGYQLGAGANMPPLLLDDEEAVAVALGLRNAAAGAVQGIEEASMRALSKIEQILPPRLGRRLAALQAMIVTSKGDSSEVNAAVLTGIAGACRDNLTLRFRYQDREGAATQRTTEPHRVVHTGRRWYLVAWDTSREAWRTFRVDRIQPRFTTGARFVPRDPPSDDLASYVSRDSWYAPICRARVKLFLPASVMTERLPRGVGILEPIDERTCMLEIGSSSWEYLAMHLALLGADFEVSEPRELIDHLHKLGARLQRAVQNL